MKKYFLLLNFLCISTNQALSTLGLNRDLTACLASDYLKKQAKMYHSPSFLIFSSLESAIEINIDATNQANSTIKIKDDAKKAVVINIAKNYIIGKTYHLGAQYILQSIEPEIYESYAPVTSKIFFGLKIYNWLGLIGVVPTIKWNPSIEYTNQSYLSVKIKNLRPAITDPRPNIKFIKDVIKKLTTQTDLCSR